MKRFSHGKGVTQPSQIRYVHYFEQVYKRIIKTPLIKQPTKIVVHTIPDLAGNGKLTPYVEIVNGTNFQLLWTNRDSLNLKKYVILQNNTISNMVDSPLDPKRQKMEIALNPKDDPNANTTLELSCDLYFRIKHSGSR